MIGSINACITFSHVTNIHIFVVHVYIACACNHAMERERENFLEIEVKSCSSAGSWVNSVR